MTRLRFKIIKQKNDCAPIKSKSFLRNAGRQIRRRFTRTLANDTLPLIIAPSFFIAFVGLEWWHWYNNMPTPSPVLLSVTTLGLCIYCLYKLVSQRRRTEKQEGVFEVINE